MTTVTFNVPSIHCEHCVHTIKTELKEVAGVADVQASLESKQVSVRYEPPATEGMIESLLAEINYPVVK
jgi:copper chaperone CopZ